MAEKKGFHIPSLDGIRTISIAIVALAHAGFRFIPGGFGVTVFFFLSGFLITTLLRLEWDKTGAVSLRDFYVRRFFRILPPFYVVLLATLALVALGVVGGGARPGHIAALVLHFGNYWPAYHGFDGQPDGTSVYWSLAVEEHFYLLFPMLFIAMRRARLGARGQAYVVWALCALILAWRCVLVFGMHVPVERTYLATDTRADSILFGCALALGANPVLDAPALSDRALRFVAVPAALVVLVASLVPRSDAFRETLRYSLQGLALTPLFIAAIRFDSSLVGRVLNQRHIAFFGVLSYVYYLTHLVVQETLDRRLPLDALPQVAGKGARLVVGFAISFALSWLLHRGVEKPMNRLRRRFLRAGA